MKNVLDCYKDWTIDLIKNDIKKKTFPYAVLMQHLQGDFNIGTVIRNANAFGAREVYYYGTKKHYDNRGDVGTRHYTDVIFIKDLNKIKELKNKYSFVALENNIDGKISISIQEFIWPKNPLILIGEEREGLRPEILELCDHLIYIPMYGSVRSLNAGCASAIAMNNFIEKQNATIPRTF